LTLLRCCEIFSAVADGQQPSTDSIAAGSQRFAEKFSDFTDRYMSLSVAERKHRMPHGAQRQIAKAEGCGDSYVTAVMNGTVTPKSPAAKRRLRRIQVALSRRLGLPVEEVFPAIQSQQDAASLVAVA
jgi:hypothetical protein